jgi:rhodanese-related sulfurtransferase
MGLPVCGLIFSELLSVMALAESAEDAPDVEEENALMLDIRDKAEYDCGHISGSINMPLHRLQQGRFLFGKNRRIIICCSDGIESVSAYEILRAEGYKVYNIYLAGGRKCREKAYSDS